MQTFLCLVGALAVAIGLVSRELNRERQKKRNSAYIEQAGGRIHYNTRPKNQPSNVINGYLRVFLGDDYFSEVDQIVLKSQSIKDVQLLGTFPELERLVLSGECADGTALSNLRLEQVKWLFIDDAVIDNNLVESLPAFPNLKTVRLYNCKLTEVGTVALNSLSDIDVEIEYRDHLLRSQDYMALRSLSKFSATLSNCPITETNLENLSGAGCEIHLDLKKAQLSEANILSWWKTNPTWSLRFAGGKDREDNKLPSRRDLPTTYELAFVGQQVSDLTLEALSEAIQLRRLNLNCNITGEGLRHLSRSCQNLQLLYISAPIVDADLCWLSDLTALTELSIVSEDFLGSGISFLPLSLTNLKLSSSHLTDLDLDRLSRLTSLTDLWLGNLHINAAGVESLSKLTTLERLYLLTSKIDIEQLDQLRMNLPNCIVYDQ